MKDTEQKNVNATYLTSNSNLIKPFVSVNFHKMCSDGILQGMSNDSYMTVWEPCVIGDD